MRMVPTTQPNEAPAAGVNRLSGRIVSSTFLGEASEHVVEVQSKQLRVVAVPPVFNPPEAVTLEFSPKDVLVLAE